MPTRLVPYPVYDVSSKQVPSIPLIIRTSFLPYLLFDCMVYGKRVVRDPFLHNPQLRCYFLHGVHQRFRRSI